VLVSHDRDLVARTTGAVLALDGRTGAASAHAGGLAALGPLDLAVAHGDRVLLRGPNGSGKSTLLAVLRGELELDAGTRRAAPGAVVAQLGQARDALEGPGPAEG